MAREFFGSDKGRKAMIDGLTGKQKGQYITVFYIRGAVLLRTIKSSVVPEERVSEYSVLSPNRAKALRLAKAWVERKKLPGKGWEPLGGGRL